MWGFNLSFFPLTSLHLLSFLSVEGTVIAFYQTTDWLKLYDRSAMLYSFRWVLQYARLSIKIIKFYWKSLLFIFKAPSRTATTVLFYSWTLYTSFMFYYFSAPLYSVGLSLCFFILHLNYNFFCVFSIISWLFYERIFNETRVSDVKG